MPARTRRLSEFDLLISKVVLRGQAHRGSTGKQLWDHFIKQTPVIRVLIFLRAKIIPITWIMEKVELKILAGFYNIYSYINILWQIQVYSQD